MESSFNLIGHWQRAVRSLFAVVMGLVLVGQLWAIDTVAAHATGAYNFPPRVGDATWVIDEASILSRLSEGKLSEQLEKLAATTGNQVRFVTIHRLDYGETIDSFTQQLFDQWFPTPEAQAQQTLIVLDNVTNTTAIRTGDAVKSLMADDIAQSVVRETMQVPLRDGNKYNQAFADAGDRLEAVLSGQPDPGPPVVEVNVQTAGTFAEETDTGSATLWVVGLLLAATIIPMATYYLYQGFQS
jgi:uncharacterized protein